MTEPRIQRIERDDWRGRAGRLLLDPNDPDGDPIATPLDRRWLWRIEAAMFLGGGNHELRQLAADLKQYLNETCEHHWRLYAAEPDIPMHSQCLWCCDVVWFNEAAK